MTIQFDNSSVFKGASTDQIQWLHTCSPSADMLIVGVSWRNAGAGTETVSSVNYDGNALTLIRKDEKFDGVSRSTALYYIENPSSGSNTAEVNFSGAGTWRAIVGAISLGGVTGIDVDDGVAGNTGDNVSTNITPSQAYDLIVDCFAIRIPTTDSIVGIDQTERWKDNFSDALEGGMSTEFALGNFSHNMSWTHGSNDGWSHSLVTLATLPPTAFFIEDIVEFSDSSSQIGIHNISSSDGFTLSDASIPISGTFGVSASDVFTLSDASTHTILSGAFVSDGFTLSDTSVPISGTFGVSASDVFTLSDVSIIPGFFQESVSAGIDLAENVFVTKVSIGTTVTFGRNTTDDYDTGKDTYINEDQDGTNYSTSQLLYVTDNDVSTSDDRRVLVDFDFKSTIKGLVGSGSISSAKVKLYVDNITGTNESVHCHKIRREWGEGGAGATWSSAFWTIEFWGSPGAANTTNDRYAAVSDTININVSEEGSYVEFDVTQDVQDVVDDVWTDVEGWIFEGTDRTVFRSDNFNDGQMPFLEIIYGTPGDITASASDGVELSETIDVGGVFSPSASDGLLLGEEVSGAHRFTTEHTASDGLLLGEEVSGAYRFPTDHTAADTLLLGEDVSGAYRFPTDHFVSAGILFGDHSEDKLFNLAEAGFLMSDFASAANVLLPSASDGINFSDIASTLITFRPAISDGFLMGDTAPNTVNLIDLIADGAIFNDQANTQFPVFVSGGFLMGETVVAGFGWVPPGVSAGFILGDSGSMSFKGSHKTITGSEITFQFISKGILQR
jgi:hypothetical protein